MKFIIKTTNIAEFCQMEKVRIDFIKKESPSNNGLLIVLSEFYSGL